MAIFENPSTEETRNFIINVEGNLKPGIYPDDSSGHFPTHGLGINLYGKSAEFLSVYIEALKFDPKKIVEHYVFAEGQWIIDTSKTDQTLLEEILWLCNSENTVYNPFHPEFGIVQANGNDYNDIRLWNFNLSENEAAFDAVVYDAYLNGKYGIRGVISNVGAERWEALNSDERLALFSLHYNSPALIGNGLKNGLELYVNGSNEEAKFVGKLACWYEILFRSNGGDNSSIRTGIQNRRFVEVNKFISTPVGLGGDTDSMLVTNTYKEASIAVAFMNQYKDIMINYFNGIGGDYANKSIEIVQNAFNLVVFNFLQLSDYQGFPSIGSLFITWNLLTDIKIDLNTGAVSHQDIVGTDLDDLIYITGNENGREVSSGAGNDEIYCNDASAVIDAGSGNDVIYGGKGDDYIIGGSGDDQIWGGEGNDTIYGGDGRDRIYGGDGDDMLFGGAGDDDLCPGAGNNIIYCGDDNDRDHIVFDNIAGFTDTVYDFKWNDSMSYTHSMVAQEDVGVDRILYFSNGSKAILKFVNSGTDTANSTQQLVQAMSSFGAEELSGVEQINASAGEVNELYNLASAVDLKPKAA